MVVLTCTKSKVRSSQSVSRLLDEVLDSLIDVIDLSMSGDQGFCERARHVMCDGEDCLSSRIWQIKQAVRQLEKGDRHGV